MKFDEETSRTVEALYVTSDVVVQRCRILEALALATGAHVLDIGVGPGLLASEMANAVGPEGRVCGIDLEPMVAMSKKRCAAQKWAEFRVADAMKLPYPDESFDAVVSTQVYEYLPDIPAALMEVHRVLRPGGRVVILDADYGTLAINTEDAPRMARILTAWDEHFTHASLPRTLSRQLRDAGFTVRHRAVVPMFNPEFRDNTVGKGMLEMMAAFAVGRNGVSRQESDAWFNEFALLDAAGKFFFSLNRYLFVADRRNGA